MDFDMGSECNESVATSMFVEMVLLHFLLSLAWNLMPVTMATKAMQTPTISFTLHYSVFIIYLWERKAAASIKMQGYANSR